jgi:transposase
LSDKNNMDKDAYIKQLEDRIIQLEKRIEELERLLGMNSRNSSKPPSSDPPGMSNEQPRHRRKKRGARNGHQPHLRELMPEKFVQKHIRRINTRSATKAVLTFPSRPAAQ